MGDVGLVVEAVLVENVMAAETTVMVVMGATVMAVKIVIAVLGQNVVLLFFDW